MKETIEVLTERAKKHLKEAVDYQTEADNATLEAGKALQKLKARITKKESAEGKEWGHSWPKFVQAKLKGECSYSHAQRLIAFAESKNPVAAIAEYRKQDAAQKRDRRASQTSENAAKKQPKGSPPRPPGIPSEFIQQSPQREQLPDEPADFQSPEQPASAAGLSWDTRRLIMLKRMWDVCSDEAKHEFMAYAGLVYDVPRAA